MKGIADHVLVIEDDYAEMAAVMAEGGSDEETEEIRREVLRYAIHCAKVTDHCRWWFECTKEHEHPDMDDWDGDTVVIDGEEHQVVNDSWMTPTERCLVVESGFESGDHSDLAREVGYIPGVYALDFDWDEGTYLRLDHVDANAEPLIEAALAKAPLNPCTRCGSREVAEVHNPCCSAHKHPRLCHQCYSRSHFVETGCCGPEYAILRKEPARA